MTPPYSCQPLLTGLATCRRAACSATRSTGSGLAASPSGGRLVGDSAGSGRGQPQKKAVPVASLTAAATSNRLLPLSASSRTAPARWSQTTSHGARSSATVVAWLPVRAVPALPARPVPAVPARPVPALPAAAVRARWAANPAG